MQVIHANKLTPIKRKTVNFNKIVDNIFDNTNKEKIKQKEII